jgi:hypothetical protein
VGLFVALGEVSVVEKMSRVSKKKSPSSPLPRERKLQICGKLSNCRFSSVKQGKVKFTLEQATKSQRGSRGTLLFL